MTVPIKSHISPPSIFVLRWIGYGLLIFALLDLLTILYPPDFLNPRWELQTIGALVERVPVPLIGFGLVFMSDPDRRPLLERLAIQGLSLLTAILAIAYFLMVPLGIVDTVRINKQLNQETAKQIETQLEQLKPFEERIQTAAGGEVVGLARANQNVLGPLEGYRERGIELADTEALRAEMLARVKVIHENVEREADIARARKYRQLIENSVKWNIGALIGSALFTMIFRGTVGVRRAKK
ncbi:hypothetical protein KR51_00035220 [Rubidibacter lacunae KORDI 51-2]|uniref:Uncharacterized protein n=1 Tax=Rubidibacter lacunae KORDI 51-2 TaxID=582515 RepID=U5DHH6_9CHRO|nr:HpsJ family protein [Rubidibacter lacunae]ERN40034.1 hypothetical protein KR51_00035220 [Rubidibacter lacunae KORDI 51-2]